MQKALLLARRTEIHHTKLHTWTLYVVDDQIHVTVHGFSGNLLNQGQQVLIAAQGGRSNQVVSQRTGLGITRDSVGRLVWRLLVFRPRGGPIDGDVRDSCRNRKSDPKGNANFGM